MLYGFCSIAILSLGSWTTGSSDILQKPEWPQKDPAARRVPVRPLDLETALLPKQLAHSRVFVEIISSNLSQSVARSGENSAAANVWRKKLIAATADVENFERAVDDSTDPQLRAVAERECEKAMSRHREELTMTEKELEARRKFEREEHERSMAELDKLHAELTRILEGKPPRAKVAGRPHHIFSIGDPAE